MPAGGSANAAGAGTGGTGTGTLGTGSGGGVAGAIVLATRRAPLSSGGRGADEDVWRCVRRGRQLCGLLRAAGRVHEDSRGGCVEERGRERGGCSSSGRVHRGVPLVSPQRFMRALGCGRHVIVKALDGIALGTPLLALSLCSPCEHGWWARCTTPTASHAPDA